MLTIQLMPTPPLAQWQQALTATEAQLQLASVRALNKTARWARSQLATQTAEAMNIPVRPVREGLILVSARRSRLTALVALKASAGVIAAKQLGRVSTNARGVRAGRRQFDRAFWATMPNGREGVFRRRGPARLPIQAVQLVITGRMREILAILAEQPARTMFERLLIRELGYLTRTR